MSGPVPEGWYRETPTLAGRRNPRGVPKPIGLFAAIVSLSIFVLSRQYFNGSLIGSIGGIVGGIAVGLAIAIPAARMVRRDRDWFAITGEYIALRFFYFRTVMRERRNGW